MNKNIVEEINNIYNTCKDIADNKTRTEINELFIEELRELIKAITKHERWIKGDISLQSSYSEIVDNLYKDLADVIIMILQFTCKKRISHKDLINIITEKIDNNKNSRCNK